MKKIIYSYIGIIFFIFAFGVHSYCEEYTILPFTVMYKEDNQIKGYDHFDRYVEDYLPDSAEEYSPELAELLMAFAYSAYDNNACYMSYQNFGFDNIHFYSHNARENTSEESMDDLIGLGIGRKTLSDGKEVVLISVRGTSTGGGILDILGLTGLTFSSEWASNFDFVPNDRGWHTGFAKSAAGIYNIIKEYVTIQNSDFNKDNAIFVVTGHSRGAAVANLLSVLLSENLQNDTGIYMDSSRVFDYNFACPDTVYASIVNPDRNSYDNIFNINVAGDIVSYVPGVIGDGLGLIDSISNLKYSMLLNTWTKYGISRWYSPDWNNDAECGLLISVHMQSNYLDKLSAHSPIEDSRYKSWEESRVAVYRSTSFEALIMDIYNLTHSPSTILRFPLDGDWILTDKDGDQYKVRFMAGQTNMLDVLNGIPGAELAWNTYMPRFSASSTFLVDIQGLAGRNSGSYIFSAVNDNHLEIYSTDSENTEKLWDMTRAGSGGGDDDPRPSSSERSIVLVLDTSGSMSGKPIQETIKAASRFLGNISSNDANIGVVDFDSDAVVIGSFGSSVSSMTDAILNMDTDGGTNFGEGLSAAADLLNSTNVKKKILILMSDGEPADGISGEDLFAYADELKESGIIIYTLGFFSEMGDGKAEAQQIMERIASPGYHYEIDDADNLSFLFEDVADQLNGQHFIFVRIECPVDVAVSYNGETLSSTDTNQNLRASFGTLSFEESTEEDPVNDSVDRRTKVLRLKEGVDYPIQITGTGQGTMNYSIGLMDRNGEYTDFRRFESIPITNTTVIDTVANTAKSTTLNVDTDSDGQYDKTYFNTPNGKASQFSASTLRLIIIAFLIILLLIEFYAKSDEIVVKKPSMKSRED